MNLSSNVLVINPSLLGLHLYLSFKTDPILDLKKVIKQAPIPDESVINFNQMNLSSNVLVINPSLFRPTSLPFL